MRVGGGGTGICDTRLGAAAAGSRLSFSVGESAGIGEAGDGLPFATEGSVNGLDALASGTLSIGGGCGGAMDADEGVDAGSGYVRGVPASGRITMTDSVTMSAGVVTVSCIRIWPDVGE